MHKESILKADSIDEVNADDDVGVMVVEWMVSLSSGEVSEAVIQEHAQWLKADPNHMLAWQKLQQNLAPTSEVLASNQSSQHIAASRAALKSPKRRNFIKNSVIVFGSGSIAYMSNRNFPILEVMADAYTATGERKTVRLADGSTVTLNARSAIDVSFTDTQRNIFLRTGECIVDVKPDIDRPFSVETKQGKVRALGTRYLVKQDQDRSFAHVLLHHVEVNIQNGKSQQLQSGESIWFDSQAFYGVQKNSDAIAAWAEGVLDIRDQTMEEVINAIRPYRKGFIRLSPQVQNLRVYGVFPLDDIDHIFKSLAETFPIKLNHYGPWLVVIEPK